MIFVRSRRFSGVALLQNDDNVGINPNTDSPNINFAQSRNMSPQVSLPDLTYGHPQVFVAHLVLAQMVSSQLQHPPILSWCPLGLPLRRILVTYTARKRFFCVSTNLKEGTESTCWSAY